MNLTVLLLANLFSLFQFSANPLKTHNASVVLRVLVDRLPVKTDHQPRQA